MPRLNDPELVMFPVSEFPVSVNFSNADGKRQLPVPSKKAIVNEETGDVLGIVGRDYRLVTNKQALDWAFCCCQAVFPETRAVEWTVKNTDAPNSGSYCFIDLVHNTAKLDFSTVDAKNRPDAFGPFIRVTNSYNGARALAFDIGYFRKVCSNGLILPTTVISFKFTHDQRAIQDELNFEVAHEKLSELTRSFVGYVETLRKIVVPSEVFLPMVSAVLLIREPANPKKNGKIAEEWDALQSHLRSLCDNYQRDLGETAYSIFNAITEFASAPPNNRFVRRDRNSLQRLSGAWLTAFCQESRHSNFKLTDYVQNLVRASNQASASSDGFKRT